jgi:dihydroxyacetone kinase-like protein
MRVDIVKDVFRGAANRLRSESDYLSEIDSQTGDGDHGVTIAKISEAIVKAADEHEGAGIPEFFSLVYDEIMIINGGSAGPLWGMMANGIEETLSADELSREDEALLKLMFEGAVSGLRAVSDAAPGDKTMMDALIPAYEAACAASGGCAEILKSAAAAAREGAERTKDMVAKYGRAKNLREKSMGYLDAGAVSVSIMVEALSLELSALCSGDFGNTL